MPPGAFCYSRTLFPFGLIFTRFDLATEVATDVVSHQIWGPRKKSWGLPMTILAGIMRNAGRHSNLVDIVRVSFPFPVGRSAVLSVLTFLVLFLRPPYDCSWDSAVLYLYRRMRSSRRSPSGCVNEDFEEYSPNSMISRMAHENYLVNGSSPRGSGSVYKQNGRLPKPILALTRPCHPVNTTRESFYISTAVSFGEPERPCVAIQSDSFWTFHITGAYYLFSPATHRSITIPLSKFTDARIFGKHTSRWFRYGTHPHFDLPTAVSYRLAPETRFPGPLHDAVSTYFRMLDDLHIPPSNILFAGDSAGGGLCLALLMYLRDNAYPLPAGAILMSPWVGESPLFLGVVSSVR